MSAPLALMTSRERAAWLASAGARAARLRCGITLRAIAEALEVAHTTVQRWEAGTLPPHGPRGEAYCRVIAGLIRHLEVPEDWDGDALATAREDAILGCHREFPDGLLLGDRGLVQPRAVTRPRVQYPPAVAS